MELKTIAGIQDKRSNITLLKSGKWICASQIKLYNTLLNARKSAQSKRYISLWLKNAEFPWRIVGLQLCGFVQGLVNAWTVAGRPLQRKQIQRSIAHNGTVMCRYKLRTMKYNFFYSCVENMCCQYIRVPNQSRGTESICRFTLYLLNCLDK